jgi:hypothetical protein
MKGETRRKELDRNGGGAGPYWWDVILVSLDSKGKEKRVEPFIYMSRFQLPFML